MIKHALVRARTQERCTCPSDRETPGWQLDESFKGIVESFPTLNREHIFGALPFYMANRGIVDQYVSEGQREFEALRVSTTRS